MNNSGNQELLRFQAKDGFTINGALTTITGANPEEVFEAPILIDIHGLLGHFLARGTTRQLPPEMLKHNVNSLSINTRLASAGQMTGQGIFDETILDIDAAVEVCLQEGFKKIFILGYSLGASMVVHWAANRKLPEVKGLILEGTHHSFPECRRKRFIEFESEPSYDEIYETAKRLLGKDPINCETDEILVAHKASGNTRSPLHSEIFSYKTWWFMMGPEADAAVAHRHIAKIQYPCLMMRGAEDPIIESWELEALIELLQGAGNNDVRFLNVPGAGHDCMANPEVMIPAIVDFLNSYSE
jgi:pimeloyl-ACP methyl ester carboxylesterase